MFKFTRLAVFFLYISIAYAEDVEKAVTLDQVQENVEVVENTVESIDGAISDHMQDVHFDYVSEEDMFADDLNTSLLKDVFLVLDNSGSMKKNDPSFLVSEAVKEFISQQDNNTRVGIVIFDQSAILPVPLTEASFSNRVNILNSLKEIDYKGLFTDSPAGIERAIYELKNNGREEAERSIIFMTDGIVDTGDAEKDIEKAKWLREDLAPDAADNDIKIFGIAFTEAADFQLIQSIAQKSDGEYYRVLKAKDLKGVFHRIDKIINEPPEVDMSPQLTAIVQTIVAPAEPVVKAPSLPPVIIEVPNKNMGEEERIRSMILIAATIVLSITLLAILFVLIRRNKEIKSVQQTTFQDAFINDISGKTDKQSHQLGTKPTMFGRIAGQDVEHLNYIVVNESTIGRRHALVEYRGYSFWIIDQGSINGTYVNGEQVKTEARLKHGDKIQLHRCEFEFVMPEMEDSGMTVISNTVFAGRSHDDSEEATVMKASHETAGELSDFERKSITESDMDFDLTGPIDLAEDDLLDLAGPEDDIKLTEKEPEFIMDDDELSEDETIKFIMDDDELSEDETIKFIMDDDELSEDETIMMDDDDDATLMPGDEDEDFRTSDETLRKYEH